MLSPSGVVVGLGYGFVPEWRELDFSILQYLPWTGNSP